MRSGFTIIRNGDSLGYPYLESLRSLAPLVDEIVVAVGDSVDATRESLAALGPDLPCELRLIDSPWDPQSLKGGFELSRQSNIALEACRHDICFYLQADEVLHENEFEKISEDLDRFATDERVDALAFRWIHFYGNYSQIVESKNWYRREIRAIKKSSGLRSYGDAQGFRVPHGKTGNDLMWSKSRAALSRGHVLHYGWVRPPQVMAAKTEALDRLWHGNARDGTQDAAHIYLRQFGLKSYQGSHPACMRSRVQALGDFDPFKNQPAPHGFKNFRLAATAAIEALTDWRPGEFKNYRSLVKY